MILLLTAALAQTTGGDPPATSGQLFRPSIDSTHTLWTDDSARADDGYFVGRGVLQYVRDPVIWTAGNGDVTRIVGDLFQLSILAGYTKGPVRIGVDVPTYLRSVGDAGGESGLGDVSLDVKGSLLDREEAPVGIALAGRATLPTATVEGPLGNRGFAWELRGISDVAVDDAVIALNLGVRGVPREELENFVWGPQLLAKLGGGYAVTDDAGVSADLGAHIGLAELDPAASPIEGMLGGWYRVDDVVLRGGVGTGFTAGFGSPQVRTLLSVSYEPPRARDTDGDGIVDKEDQCPEDPEDFDGFKDEDGCSEPTLVTLVVLDPDGAPVEGARYTVRGPVEKTGRVGTQLPLPSDAYTLDLEAEGYVGLSDQALKVPDGELHKAVFTLEPDVVPGKLTVTILGSDGEPIEGASWAVRGDESGPHPSGEMKTFPPGAYALRATAEGYRPKAVDVELADGSEESLTLVLEPAKVELTKEKIDIRESVYFETGKAVIKAESFGLLDEVAQLMGDHPELTKIRIEGHTDARGSESSNLSLSKRRAKSVLDYLVSKGVDAGRLESEGYGEAKPIQTGNNEAAWSKNRRVDFFVAERSDEE